MSMHQLPRPNVVHLADIQTRFPVFTRWERHRHRNAHWFVECIAESLGVFFYVYAGVGSTAGFVIGNLTGQTISSLFTIGLAYAFGIMLALITCSATSGGHFNPVITMCMVVFKGFSKRKALRYIVFQILGAYVAALVIYLQWRHNIKAVEALLKETGKFDAVNFTPQGLAGIFALYLPAGGSLGQAFWNEFVCDWVIGVVIWSCMDPTNFNVPPHAAPWIIAFSYSICVWGYSPIGLSTNSARDLGTRLAMMTIWGKPAAGGAYAAIAALTNIPATFLAALFYEFILTDSSRVVTPAHVSWLGAHLAHEEHFEQTKGRSLPSGSSYTSDGKAQIETVERA